MKTNRTLLCAAILKTVTTRAPNLGSLALAFALTIFIASNGESQQAGTGDGLLGRYFDNRHLHGTPVTNRVDSVLDFDWGSGAPVGTTASDEFSVRWTGELQAQYTEPYTISIESDDGVRVWLNEQLIINDWVDRPAPEATANVNLVAGQRYLLRIEYYENHLYAGMRLRWSSPSTPKQIIPQSQLYSAPMDVDQNGLPDLWEIAYFGHIGVDPAGDDDSDGLTNLQEYRRSSNPRQPLDRGVPNEWAHGDLGSSIGDANYSNGVFTVVTTGRARTNDIGGGADAFHFLFQPLEGNGEIVGRVLDSGSGGVGNNAKVGVMFRLKLNDNSPYAALIGVGTNGLAFQQRGDAVNSYLDPSAGPPAPYWIKGVRWSDDNIGYHAVVGYTSPDGTNWTLMGVYELPSGMRVPPRIYAGLAVASPQPDSPVGARIDQIRVSPVTKLEIEKGTPFVGTGDGLTGRYYSNPDLTGTPTMTRVDRRVNFIWMQGAPTEAMPSDYFSIAWIGEIQAQYTEPYTLYFKSDDGVRIWLDGRLIIDNWTVGVNEFSASVNLTAGQKYLLQIEYFENRGGAQARFFWSSPSTPKRIVPHRQLYSKFTDTDSDGLPDLWEKVYFGDLRFGPNDDPDGDGLTNLQEFGYHTNPNAADTDGDGMPDGWEIGNGLNPLDPADAARDGDFDGLTNLREFQLGTNPRNSDTDGDGVPDGVEVNFAHTDPLASNPGLVTEVMKVNGAEGTNILGQWQVDGNHIYALDRRGSVDFVLTNARTNKFLLQIEGIQNHPHSFTKILDLAVSIDGENLGHRPLAGGYGTNGVVEYVTPYLRSGKHIVRVFWDGAARFSSLRIKHVRLESIAGPDSNGDGIVDWVAAMLSAESGRDTNASLSSYVSPFCLEGRDPYLSFMNLKIESAEGPIAWPVYRNAGKRWYSDVPLETNGSTIVKISYQNQGLIERHQLKWEAFNILTITSTPPILIRKADSLLITARPPGRPHGNVLVVVSSGAQDVGRYTTTTRNPAPFQFTNAGNYAVSVTYTPENGGPAATGSTSVKVIEYGFSDNPVCGVGKARDWSLTNVPSEVVLESDPRLNLSLKTNSSANIRISSLLIDQNEPRTIVCRAGTNGSICASSRADGVTFFAGPDTYNKVIEKYGDGSRLVETMLISSPVLSNVTFQINVIVGGITFDDGTTYRELAPADFDELGQYVLRFLVPAAVQSANCHRITMMQGTAKIGNY